jgi:peptidoglycan-associated lipoprotein
MQRSLAANIASNSAAAEARGLTRRRLPGLAAFALVAAMGLAACSTTDGSGAGSGSDGSTAGRGVDRGVTGAALTGDQLREALTREGVSDRVLFGYDSAELNPEARGIVEKWAKVLNQAGGTRVVVEGHCDERGTREYNLALGERRAVAVRNYLTSLGVTATRMQTISYGKEKPVVVGSSEESWAQNRRGVLAVE